MKNKHNINISRCICPDCKSEFPIPRIRGREREKGHLKTIWCPFCKKTQVMTEYKYVYKNYYGEIIAS